MTTAGGAVERGKTEGISGNAKRLLALLSPAADAASPRTWLTVLRAHRAALTVFAVGTLASIFTAAFVRMREEARARDAFDYRAEQVAGVLERGLTSTTEVLLSIPPYFETTDGAGRSSTDPASAEAFRRFVAPALARHPGMAMVEWAPVVPGSERAKFEAAIGARVPGYRIHTVGPEGPQPAPVRESYSPLLFIEPPSPTALGIDLDATSARNSPISQAARTGRVTVSPRFTLFEDAPGVPSISAYAPAYRPGAPTVTEEDRARALLGVAVAIFRLQPVVAKILAGEDTRTLSVALLDEGMPEGQRLLVETAPPPKVPRPFAHTRAFTFGDRTYATRIQADPRAYATGNVAVWVFVLGWLASLAAAAATTVVREIHRLREEARLAAKLGMYTLERKLGEGAMGVVYLGHHALLRRPTAIKVLPVDGPLVDRAAIERFEREVRVTSQLTHPNTIAVYDYGRSPRGIFYYAMEFLDGPDLAALVARVGPLPASRVVHLLRGIVGSLAEAHAAGLVHRDVKPANIIVCTRGGIADFVKVLDFGLVRSVAKEAAPDKSEGIAGTPLYMAPEALISPDEIRPSVDVYAVGAVAYFLLTGRTPLDGATMTELFAKVLSVVPEPPSLSSPHHIPRVLDELILRCLAKEPSERPRSMDELLALLEACEAATGRWTEAEARAFWRGPGRSILEQRAEQRVSAELAATLTMEIDLRRVPSIT